MLGNFHSFHPKIYFNTLGLRIIIRFNPIRFLRRKSRVTQQHALENLTIRLAEKPVTKYADFQIHSSSDRSTIRYNQGFLKLDYTEPIWIKPYTETISCYGQKFSGGGRHSLLFYWVKIKVIKLNIIKINIIISDFGFFSLRGCRWWGWKLLEKSGLKVKGGATPAHDHMIATRTKT